MTLVNRYPYTAWLSGVLSRGGCKEEIAGDPVAEAKRDGAEAAKRACAAARAAKEAKTEDEVAAANSAKEVAKAMAKAASLALRKALQSDSQMKGERLAYVGAVPFDFGAFPGCVACPSSSMDGTFGERTTSVSTYSWITCVPVVERASRYSHQATTKVDQGALDVATRCLTHVWRRHGSDASSSSQKVDATMRREVPDDASAAQREKSGKPKRKAAAPESGDEPPLKPGAKVKHEKERPRKKLKHEGKRVRHE